MGEDDLPRVGDAKLHLDHLGRAPDDLAGVAADHVHADDVALLLIDENLADAVRTLVLGHEATGVAHGQLLHLVIDALLPALLLGAAHGGDLGVGVDHRRVGVVAHAVALAQDGVDGDLGLAVGGVGQHVVAVHVADGVHIRHIGAALRVGGDARTGEAHADALQAQALHVGAAADGQKHLVGGHGALLAARILDPHLAGLHGQALVAQQEAHTLLLKLLLEQGGDLPVGGSGDVIQHLHHRDLRAHGGVVGGHLQADHAAADDGQFAGNCSQLQHLAVGEHEGTQVLPHAGNAGHHGGGAGGDQQPFASVNLAVGSDLEALGGLSCDGGLLHDHGHARTLHLCAHAGHQRPDDLRASGVHGALVDAHTLAGHAVQIGVQRVLVGLGGVQQRLGGNAALVQAHAAQGIFLKQQGAQPRVRSALCGQIAARAAADDDQIIGICHGVSLLCAYIHYINLFCELQAPNSVLRANSHILNRRVFTLFKSGTYFHGTLVPTKGNAFFT